MATLNDIISRGDLLERLSDRASVLYERRVKIAARIEEAVVALETKRPLDVAFDLGTSGREIRLLYLLHQLQPESRRDLLVFHGGLEPGEAEAVLELLPRLQSATPLTAGWSLVFPSLHLCDEGQEYQEALDRIRAAEKNRKEKLELVGLRLGVLPPGIAVLSELTSLDLCFNRLERLPPEIGSLRSLRVLNVGQNQLTSLPPEIGRLDQLGYLDVGYNRLQSLPPQIGQLRNLQHLDSRSNALTSLPSELGQLALLKHLIVEYNQLRSIPASIGHLSQLKSLLVGSNKIASIPTEIGRLQQLDHLLINSNRLTSLPAELGKLPRLKRLEAFDNPLPYIPSDLVDDDGDALLVFLRELAAERYEAKLLLLGDGGQGKTCLSRALRGEKFEHQDSTRGINVDSWRFAHPDEPGDENKEITLWIWDFEGQEINHQSHQFFLTRRSLYAVVWSGRHDARMDRLEYWLDTIRARAPGCRVLIVATECESRSPALDLDRLKARFGEMLLPDCYHRVGCENGRNIPELRARITMAARELELVPHQWPTTYQQAESALRCLAETQPYISRNELNGQLTLAGIQPDHHEVVAGVLGDTGVITHFPNSLDLQDFVVLKPSWLTQAISEALEADTLVEQHGEMELRWLEELWRERYPGMFPRFYGCMRQFELCYPLEDERDRALVPLRFGFSRPEIPWSEIPDAQERQVEYRFGITAPAGLMSRFIVKTHRLIVKTTERPEGIFWRNGVFLKSGEDATLSEALCVFDEVRMILQITVRSIYPQTLVEQLDYVARSVFAFFEGLHPDRYYRCIRTLTDGNPCPGAHEEKLVALHLSRGKDLLCRECLQDMSPVELVYGLNSFAWEDRIRQVFRGEIHVLEEHAKDFGLGFYEIRERLQEIDSRLERADESREELLLRIEQSQREIITALDRAGLHLTPRIFTLTALERHPLNPAEVFNKNVQLRFYCEHEQPHPGDARYKFTLQKEWWRKTAPVVRAVFKILNVATLAGLPLRMDIEAVKHEVGLMKAIAAELPVPEQAPDASPIDYLAHRRIRTSWQAPWRYYNLLESEHKEVLRAFAELTTLVKGLDPAGFKAHSFGNLRRYLMLDNTFRWLCDEHGKQYR